MTIKTVHGKKTKGKSVASEYVREYVGGRIISGTDFVGEYVADITGRYIAWRIAGGRARRFESRNGQDLMKAFESYMDRNGFDTTYEVCRGVC